MRKHLLTIIPALFICIGASAQANSVELRDGNGAVFGQYNSITSAYGGIPTPLTQPFVIELTSSYTASNETYPINFTALAGASEVNSVTIRPAANVSNITISNNGSGTNVVLFNDADYITIDGRPGGVGNTNALTIANTATTSSSNTVVLMNGSCFNTIRNCNINNATTTGTGRALFLSTSASNVTGNSDNLFYHCIFTGGRYMINSNGTAANSNTRNIIRGCDVVNIPFAGIWYQAGTAKLTIDSNRFYCTVASGDGPYVMLFDSQKDTVIISRNQIYDINNGSLSSLVKGISFRTVTGVNYSLIHNNMIALSSPNTASTSVYGIEYATGTGAVNAGIYYNTVRVQGSLTTGGSSGTVISAAFFKSGTGASAVYNIYNNIFINERTGGLAAAQHVAMALNSTAGAINSNYNTYNATSGNHVRYGSVLHSNLGTYQAAVTAPNETNTNFNTVQFTSATDLHLAGSSLGNANLQGVTINLPAPLPNVNIDLDNEVRGGVPYRGADESLSSPLSLDLLNFSGIWNNEDVSLQWSTASEKNHKEFVVERSSNGGDFTAIEHVMGKGTITSGAAYEYTDHKPDLSKGKLYYRLHIVEADGTVAYSQTILLQKKLNGTIETEVYPIPFKDQLTIRHYAQKAGDGQIRIVDIAGKVMISKQLTLHTGDNEINLSDLGVLPPGMYYLQIHASGINQTIQISK